MDPVSSNWPHVLGLSLVFCGTLGIFKSSCSACFISARPTAEGWLGGEVPGRCLGTSNPTGQDEGLNILSRAFWFSSST